MDEKDVTDGPHGGSARPPTASSSTEVDDHHPRQSGFDPEPGPTLDVNGYDRDSEKGEVDDEAGANDSDDDDDADASDHGEPDIDHDEIEAAVPGHEFDVELRKVSLVACYVVPCSIRRCRCPRIGALPIRLTNRQAGPRRRESQEGRDPRQRQE